MRPARLQTVRAVSQAELTLSGLSGDHGRAGKRAVTLFQHEHLDVLARFLGVGSIAPARLRRNIHVSGLNLSALRGVPLHLGEAIVEITVPCAPCSRMQTEFGPGGYNALRGHGGWCAQVLRPGRVVLGDHVARSKAEIG